jgi:hypothetical protein
MSLHQRSDDELKAMLAAGALSEKRADLAQAVLRGRRLARVRGWLSKHSWIAAVVAAIGVSALLLPGLNHKART